ncbi:MAG TPA: hypothetical protein VIK53_04135 [Verrucomicrobiae bacterium]
MNALVKKEIRLLLPSFLIGIALTFANCFWKQDFSSQYGVVNYSGFVVFVSFVFCPAIAVFMALNSFGAEFSAGTFSMLLAQPVSRSRVWWMKVSALATGLLIGGLVWCAILFLRVETFPEPSKFRGLGDVLLGVWVFLLVIYSGALWTVLLLRQVAAAFWFTLLVPGAILVVISALVGENHPEWFEPVASVAMLIYGIAGFLFARRLFLRAQDVTWTGGTIAMPEMRGLPAWFSRSAARRVFRPRAALWWKEIQLHQSQFIMAGVLVLLHLGVLAVRKFGSYQRSSTTEFVLEIFWRLWLVMPVLVGAAAVAEERKLGTLAGQFCLPVKRRTQFAVKFLVAMLLSVLFGAVMPLLLEGSRILPNVHSDFSVLRMGMSQLIDAGKVLSKGQVLFWNGLSAFNACLPLLTLAGIAAAIGAISFYASTLTRNTLQALAPAVLGLLLMFFLFIVTSQPGDFGFHFPWNGLLVDFIGVPVFFIVLVAMSSWNFQRINLGWNVWRRNAFAFAAALVFVFAATTATYHRVWKKLTPFEPPHGAARLTLSNPATLSDQWDTLSVRLPDGRMWMDNHTIYTANLLTLSLGDIRLMMGGGHILDGSNWVSIVSGFSYERAGIKADGTLWVSEKPPPLEQMANGRWIIPKAGDLVQFGSETNWNSVVPNGLSMLLVKNEGTLWRWGITTNWNWKNEWPDLRSFTPQRLGTDTNWSEVFLEDGQLYFRKNDGSFWTYWNGSQEPHIQLPELSPGQASLPSSGQWRGTAIIENSLNSHLGVRNDGTFRIWAEKQMTKNANGANSYELAFVDMNRQLGKDTNWLTVAGRGEKIVTLKNDGTLWLWNFYHDNRRGWDTERDERAMLAVKPVRLDTHSDWIAITTADGGVISLAADGSLWYWPLASASDFVSKFGGSQFWDNNSHTYFESLLDISRKPQLLGNIFTKKN